MNENNVAKVLASRKEHLQKSHSLVYEILRIKAIFCTLSRANSNENELN